MRTIIKFVTAAALTGALAMAMATPSQARHGRNAAAIGGFAAGAVIGAAAANAAYGPYYDYGPGYAYDSGYAAYGYDDAPGPVYYGSSYGPANDAGRACIQSPASPNFGACD